MGTQGKQILDLRLTGVERLHERYVLLRAANPDGALPPMVAGQFAQLRVDGSAGTFLRRPISIHFVDEDRQEVWFLVQTVGEGTRALARLSAGDTLNAVLPLGRGFTPAREGERLLLVGGGVGVAPLLQLGKEAQRAGAEVTFLLGARSAEDLLQLPLFERYGRVFVTTEDGTAGERGFVTQHSLLSAERFSRIAVCGPKPMMVAVARYAKSSGTPCEVSLENMMACGVGACLCCVEDTTEGHVCVCTEGPVFNIERLKWQI
ncbi:MAG: dihydroorotate dehydrogenase electron transfer subunit [Bacteroidaceae bacterium]|nr:dihydroorotate dehydrogenase electron transfer subunit [Bacteroidaceae bacterium]